MKTSFSKLKLGQGELGHEFASLIFNRTGPGKRSVKKAISVQTLTKIAARTVQTSAKDLLLLGILALGLAPLAPAQNVSLFATGLNNPRGLKFGPDRNLYVAEGGLGGSTSTVGLCNQVPSPVGPYTGGYTGRISRISPDGKTVTTVADNLPSSQTAPTQGSLVSGVADVAFIGRTLYAILAGAGCSHGVLGMDNGVLRVNADGSTTLLADLSAFQERRPVANPQPDDFEPDGTWYSMVAVHDTLFAIEPNHGELDSISEDGHIHRIADISRIQGHIVPTTLVFDGRDFLVGNLDLFPIRDGSSKIMKITKDGFITTILINLSDITGMAIDRLGRLYVLENTTGNPFPTPFTAKILRVDGPNNYTVIADGSSTMLALPTAMTFGPDGNLYVSNWGFGLGSGGGQILKVKVPY